MVDHEAKQVGLPDEIVGYVAGTDEGRDQFPYRYAAGRALTAADEGYVGHRARRRPCPQERVDDRRHDPDSATADFTVVGILEPTLTLPDSQAFMPLAAPRSSTSRTCRLTSPRRLVAADTITHIVVYPKAGCRRRRARGRSLEATLPNVTTLTAERVRRDDRLDGQPPQRNHRRRRAHQPDRRRPVRRQHDGHVGQRAHPRDRDQARDRRHPPADRRSSSSPRPA